MTHSELADESGTDRTKTIPSLWTDLWGKAKALTVTVLILSLVALNILTLIDDAIHSMAYGVLESLTERAAVKAVAERLLGRPILENSPTNNRKKDVRIATKKLEAEKASLDKEKKTLIGHNDDLMKAKKDLDGKYAALQNDTNELKNKNNVLEREKKDLANKHDTLEKSKKDLEAKHDELQKVGQKNNGAVKKTSGKIARRSVTLVARNVSSMAAEAIPLAGTAVIVAVTAWDVYDSCQTLKELNEMSTEIGIEPEDENRVCGVHVPTQKELMDQLKSDSKEAYDTAREWLTLPGH